MKLIRPFLLFSIVILMGITHSCGDDDPVPVFSNFAGTALDDVTGLPLEGVKISATSGDLEASDITDQEGKYKISNLPLNVYTLTASKAGYLDDVNENEKLEEVTNPSDFRLIPMGSIIGIVQDEEGIVLEDVEVSLSKDGNLITVKNTNSLGQYAFDRLETGSHRLNFKKQGYVTANEELNVSNGAPKDFDKTLERLATLNGKIIDKERDEFLQGANISLSRDGDASQDVISTEFGDFAFADLPDGTYTLVVRLDGYETAMEEDIKIEAGTNVIRNFFMQPKTPVLKVDTEEVDFGTDLNNIPITITNEGEGTMMWEIVENIDWLFVTPEIEQTPPSETETVILQVDRSALSPGLYSGQITISTERSGSEVVEVKVTVAGQLIAQPQVIDFGADLVSEVVTIKNTGQGIIDYTTQTSHPWLRVSPSTGTADADGVPLEITIDRDGVPPGNHSGSVFISSNAGAANIIVKMLVPDAVKPQLTLSTEELNFTNTGPDVLNIEVSNSGEEELDWSYEINTDWIEITPAPDQLDDLQFGEVFPLAVRVNRSALTEGVVHQGSIDFDSDGGGARVDVFVSTRATAIIWVSTDELDFGAALNELKFDIENRGNQPLDWAISPDQDWIEVSRPQGFDNAEIIVTVNRDLVTAGTSHSGNLRITSNGGEDQFIQVTMLTKSFPPDLSIGTVKAVNENGDQTPNPGETITLRVPIVNSDAAEVGNANELNVEIATDHPLLGSYRRNASRSILRVGETWYVDLELTIPQEIAFDETIDFEVDMEDGEGNQWNEGFTITVKPFLAEGLKALFDFDQQEFEEVLSGINGLTNGSEISSDTPSGEGFSINLDASKENFLEIGRNWLRNFGQTATLSVWIKSDQTDTPMTLFHASQENNDQCVLEIVDENQVMAPNLTFTKNTEIPLLDGAWHLLVVVLTEDISELYIDNALVNETNDQHTLLQFSTLAQGWVFGRKGSDREKYFDGLMDNIRIYDRALSPTEVSLLFDSKQ